jgi:hypothetical protein
MVGSRVTTVGAKELFLLVGQATGETVPASAEVAARSAWCAVHEERSRRGSSSPVRRVSTLDELGKPGGPRRAGRAGVNRG